MMSVYFPDLYTPAQLLRNLPPSSQLSSSSQQLALSHQFDQLTVVQSEDSEDHFNSHDNLLDEDAELAAMRQHRRCTAALTDITNAGTSEMNNTTWNGMVARELSMKHTSLALVTSGNNAVDLGQENLMIGEDSQLDICAY